ncbi:hypothetical protein [Angustibacter aerolatus]
MTRTTTDLHRALDAAAQTPHPSVTTEQRLAGVHQRVRRDTRRRRAGGALGLATGAGALVLAVTTLGGIDDRPQPGPRPDGVASAPDRVVPPRAATPAPDDPELSTLHLPETVHGRSALDGPLGSAPSPSSTEPPQAATNGAVAELTRLPRYAAVRCDDTTPGAALRLRVVPASPTSKEDLVDDTTRSATTVACGGLDTVVVVRITAATLSGLETGDTATLYWDVPAAVGAHPWLVAAY